jgi:hypothetical protein
MVEAIAKPCLSDLTHLIVQLSGDSPCAFAVKNVIYYRCIGDKSRKIAMNPEMEENPIRFQAKNDIL